MPVTALACRFHNRTGPLWKYSSPLLPFADSNSAVFGYFLAQPSKSPLAFIVTLCYTLYVTVCYINKEVDKNETVKKNTMFDVGIANN